MRNVILAAAIGFGVLLLAKGAFAQSNLTVRPSGGFSTYRCQHSDHPLLVQSCAVREADDELDPANHFDCQPATPSSVTTHTVTVPAGDGSTRFTCVSVNSDGTISDDSNWREVQDVPGKPVVLD